MNKSKVELFLEKVNLGGIVNKVFVETNDETSFIKATSDEGDLMIHCVSEAKLFEPGENIGIYDISQFLRYLSLLQSDDVKYKLYKNDDGQFYKLAMVASGTTIDYTLSAEENIPKGTDLKKEPEISFGFKMTEDLATKIKKAIDTSGSKLIYFAKTKKGFVLNVGDVKSKDHVIKIKLESVKDFDVFAEGDTICFDSKYLRNILNVNTTGTLKMLSKSTMLFNNKEDNIETTYYQKRLKEKDI